LVLFRRADLALLVARLEAGDHATPIHPMRKAQSSSVAILALAARVRGVGGARPTGQQEQKKRYFYLAS